MVQYCYNLVLYYDIHTYVATLLKIMIVPAPLILSKSLKILEVEAWFRC